MNNGGQPWDNPSGDSGRITNKVLFQQDIQPGQTWEVVIFVMEEDGQTAATAQSVLAALLANTGNPYAIAAATLLSILTKLGIYLSNSDDYIGSFAAKITNNGGQVSVSWRGIDRVYQMLNYKNGYEFDMNGDGSSYKCWTCLNVT